MKVEVRLSSIPFARPRRVRRLVLASFMLLVGCGRVSFQWAIDAAMIDAARRDGGSLDAGGRDAGTDAGPPCIVNFAGDYTGTLPALPVDPAIDGVLDCALPLRAVPNTSWVSYLMEPFPTGQRAEYAAAWRPTGIYLFVALHDPSRLPARGGELGWCGDAIELFVDDGASCVAAPQYDAPGTFQGIVGAPPNLGDVVTSGARYDFGRMIDAAAWPTANVHARATADGYALEAFITAADLELGAWTLSSGMTIGFNVGIDLSVLSDTATPCAPVDMMEGNRLGQYFLFTKGPLYPNDTPFFDCSAFLRPTLAAP